MATAGEMVTKTAEVFGVNVSALESIDRVLVVAGLRHKGGRGRSGAHMTARDISHLAIAAAHDAAMKDAAALVGKVSALPLGLSRFRSLPASDAALDMLAESTDWSFPPSHEELEERLPGAGSLMVETTMGAAMARVIDLLADEAGGDEEMQVTIRFSNEGPKATILYQVGQAQLELSYLPSKDEWIEPVVERNFRLVTKVLRRLAQVIHDD